MAIKCGFFNAIDGDRKYDAEDMGRMISSIFKDGVSPGWETAFTVTPGTGLSVNVGAGRAWFKNVWIQSDSAYNIAIDSPGSTARTDLIYFKVDKRDSGRTVSIEYFKDYDPNTINGDLADGSVWPSSGTLDETGGIFNYAIAFITVSPGVTSIASSKIKMLIGLPSEEVVPVIGSTPYIQVADIPFQYVMSNVQNEFNDWFEGKEEEFDTWFQNLQDELDENQAAHLQQEIDDLEAATNTQFTNWATDNLVVYGFTVKDNFSVAKNSAEQATWNSSAVPATRNGYSIVSRTPIQTSVTNATSSGSNSAWCVIVGNVSATSCYVRNLSTSAAAKVKVTCYYLYQKLPNSLSV